MKRELFCAAAWGTRANGANKSSSGSSRRNPFKNDPAVVAADVRRRMPEAFGTGWSASSPRRLLLARAVRAKAVLKSRTVVGEPRRIVGGLSDFRFTSGSTRPFRTSFKKSLRQIFRRGNGRGSRGDQSWGKTRPSLLRRLI